MKRADLQSKTAITNAVMTVLSETNLSAEDSTLNKAIIVYHYYSELESGGHEALYRWFGLEIKAMGIDQYLNKLIGILEKIDAHQYAMIEKNTAKRCGVCT